MQAGRLIRSLFVIAALALPLAAQSPRLTALAIVKKAVAAAGGDAWARPQTLRLRGHATFYALGEQANEIHVPNYQMWRVFPTENKAAHQANGRVRFDAFIGEKRFFQIAFDGQKTFAEFSPEAEREREAAKWENSFGFGILRFARDPGFVLTPLADDQIEGHLCYFVRVVDPNRNVTDFGIDQKDFAIRSVSFKTPRGFHQRIYSDFKWHQKPRFRQPTRVRLYYDGVKWTDITWQEFAVNQPISETVFQLGQLGAKP
jgi:hypothetical protein